MLLASLLLFGFLSHATAETEDPFNSTFSVPIQWNELALAGVRSGSAKPTLTAHQLFLVSAAMYDAVSMYHATAAPYALTLKLKQPEQYRTFANRKRAMSYAAYEALTRLFPDFETEHGYFKSYMQTLGYGLPTKDRLQRWKARPHNEKHAGFIGVKAVKAVFREHKFDGSNYKRSYKEITSITYPYKYQPVNEPTDITIDGDLAASFDRNRWQPLRVPHDEIDIGIVDSLNVNEYGDQEMLTPHWGAVTPFALAYGSQFRPSPPPYYGDDNSYKAASGSDYNAASGKRYASGTDAYIAQFTAVLAASAALTDEQKTIAEFWADGPRTESPPGHWNQLARGLARRDNLSNVRTVKMFFAMNAALLDASIATWEAKRYYDYIRPATAIRWLYRNQQVQAWAGPNQGTAAIPGQDWTPYQRLNFVTPPFQEYVSGHSAFSRAAAEVLTRFLGSSAFYDGSTLIGEDIDGDGNEDLLGEHKQAALSLAVEDAPTIDITLQWPTLLDAADEAAISRIYGGIHIQDGDLRGRELGRKIGIAAIRKARTYFRGDINQ